MITAVSDRNDISRFNLENLIAQSTYCHLHTLSSDAIRNFGQARWCAKSCQSADLVTGVRCCFGEIPEAIVNVLKAHRLFWGNLNRPIRLGTSRTTKYLHGAARFVRTFWISTTTMLYITGRACLSNTQCIY